MLYPWSVAEVSMRQARRRVIPPIPPTLKALADYLEINPQRYSCCGQSFFMDRVIDDQNKTSIVFGCLDLIRQVVEQGVTNIHADATFKVVPSRPESRPLFMMHVIVQNHVSICYINNLLISTYYLHV